MTAQDRYNRLTGDLDFLIQYVQQQQIELRYFMGAIVLVILIIIFKR